MGFDLRKLEFRVISVHFFNLFFGRSAQHFDNLNQLVDPTITREHGLTQHEFGQNTTRGPDINHCRVIGGTEYQLRCSIISGTDV